MASNDGAEVRREEAMGVGEGRNDLERQEVAARRISVETQ